MTSDVAGTRSGLPAHERISAARRWAMLAVGTAASAASVVMVTGPAFLIPVLHDRHGMTLAQAGLVASAPMTGMMLALVAWGTVVDRRGERFALLTGLGTATLAGALATQVGGFGLMAAALFVAGAAGASTNSASGRVVVGWFPPERRGLAMGIRQTGQPIGVGLGAATIAVLAERHGAASALWVPVVAGAVALVGVALVVLDPPRPERSATDPVRNPYREDGFLARVHGASVLLVVPQFLVWTFGLTWLVDHLGWDPGPAGLVIAGTQLVGAAARIGSGHLSDLVGSRMRPMRTIAALAAATMLALGVAASFDGPVATTLAVLLLVVASAVTVADNGLAFTAVAERAGPFWSGRALGVQNTAQHLVASAVPPLAGLTITVWGYGATYAVAAAMPLLALAVVPVRQERAFG
ncbi:MAG TPA: MFS transporter [Nocardioides sp.]|nr:MFS transporter [Nocardioides sp.]